MTRVKSSVTNRRRHKKVLKMVEGQRGSRSRHYRRAHEAMIKSLAYAYRHRRERKRDFRRLWILRINAAARQNGLSYSRLIAGLRAAGVAVNRKILADLAVRDAAAFARLVETARQALGLA